MNDKIKQRFPAFHPLKTFSGANNRLRDVPPDVLTMVVRVVDGFIPLAIVGERTSIHAMALAEAGICVTNEH